MRYNQPCVCGRSSSGRARPCQGRGSEFEPRRPLQKNKTTLWVVLFFVACRGPRLERVRAQREKRAGGTFWCPCACRGAAAPRASLVARSKIETPSERMVFSFWNIAADGFELAASTCAKRVKSRGGAGFPRMALPFVGCRGPRLKRVRAQREKRAGGTFWCPCACRGAAAPRASLVARSKKTRPPFGWSCFLERARVQNEVRLARPVSSGGGGSCRRYGYPPAR